MTELPRRVEPRLALVETPQEPLARELFAELAAGSGILNLHRMMAHAPALMKASYDMARAFRGDTQLPRPIVELVVMRTAQLLDADYIWARHLAHARSCGVTAPQIDELAQWPQSTAFTAAEKAALAFAEKAALRVPIADEDFAALTREFSPRAIVEITMLVGNYVSTAILIQALAVPAEKT